MPRTQELQAESLSHDAIHGYIPFISHRHLSDGEVAERDLIDHPWVQRLRQIHQLQTAWWVFPTAEHTRFQHVLGAMHLGSRAVAALYESLSEVCPDVPSQAYVETLVRMAGLLHDVGHGPFGHFFDDHYLSRFGLTHETLGSHIVLNELGDLLRGVRRNPSGRLAPHEVLDPEQIAFLIVRPAEQPGDDQPRWLRFLQALFSGIYTIDNMDFVLRDSYMSGYNTQAFDLDRLLNYSFFSESGLTIHQRAVEALVRFIGVRAELFRSIYFHRTVRAIDLSLKDLFSKSIDRLFPGNPIEHIEEYRQLTDWSLLVEVSRWKSSGDAELQELGAGWNDFLQRRIRWKMICQRHLVFGASDSENSSIFSDNDFVERALRAKLPSELREIPLRIDLARHVHRPDTRGPAWGLNFLNDSTTGKPRALTDDQLFRQLPISHRICRIYAESTDHAAQLSAALDALIGPGGSDDLTNM